ncbi:hypothetical protein NtRootA1_43990 [Arthrobacter sp. NtRootA1]|nr:hypothetical protein NtRootA1_43990 [Arthrobacter sp. NtRootA1]
MAMQTIVEESHDRCDLVASLSWLNHQESPGPALQITDERRPATGSDSNQGVIAARPAGRTGSEEIPDGVLAHVKFVGRGHGKPALIGEELKDGIDVVSRESIRKLTG